MSPSSWSLVSSPKLPNQAQWNGVISGMTVDNKVIFVAVGFQIQQNNPIQGKIFFSFDADNWTEATINVSTQSVNFTAVAFGNANDGLGNLKDMFVVVSDDGKVLYAPTLATDSGILDFKMASRFYDYQSSFSDLIYGNGIFIAVGTHVLNNETSSILTWKQTTIESCGSFSCIAYDDDHKIFVALQDGDSGAAVYSTDGTNWVGATTLPEGIWGTVSYGNGKFVAFAASDTQDTQIITSTNGITWTAVSTSFAKRNWQASAYGGKFYAVSDGHVLESDDGTSFTETAVEVKNWAGICYSNDLFLAVGNKVAMTLGHISCYVEGTKITVLVDGEEKDLPIEELKKGMLVKTYKRGYLPIHLLGRKKFINRQEISGERIFVHKASGLKVTGYHFILVDEIPAGAYDLGLRAEDKKLLEAMHSEAFEPLKQNGLFTLYHIVLDSEDKDKNIGIYADGVLSESTTLQSFLEQKFELL